MNIVRRINTARLDRSRRGGVLAGCLIALGVVVVLLIIGGIIVAMNIKTWTADLTVTAATEMINESSLPDSEKPELIAIVENLSQDWKDGDIKVDQFFTVLAKVTASDVLPIGAAYVADAGYIQTSGLTDEEKADGALQMMRVAQGLYDGAITREAYQQAFAPMADTSSEATVNLPDEGEVELLIFRDKGTVTDDQLREVIANAKTLADDNGVTMTPAMIDLSDALQAVVDESLGRTTPTPADPAPADDENSETNGSDSTEEDGASDDA